MDFFNCAIYLVIFASEFCYDQKFVSVFQILVKIINLCGIYLSLWFFTTSFDGQCLFSINELFFIFDKSLLKSNHFCFSKVQNQFDQKRAVLLAFSPKFNLILTCNFRPIFSTNHVYLSIFPFINFSSYFDLSQRSKNLGSESNLYVVHHCRADVLTDPIILNFHLKLINVLRVPFKRATPLN